MATHSSILALELPWLEEPGSLQPMGSQRVRHKYSLHARTEQLNSQRQVRILDAGGCREEWSQSLMGTEFQFGQMKNVLGTDEGDGCIRMRVFQRPPHCTLKDGGNSRLCCMSFATIFKPFLIEVELIYNTVLVSSVQQSDSIIHKYIFFFRFFSIVGYYKKLKIIPCAIQPVFVIYLLE